MKVHVTDIYKKCLTFGSTPKLSDCSSWMAFKLVLWNYPNSSRGWKKMPQYFLMIEKEELFLDQKSECFFFFPNGGIPNVLNFYFTTIKWGNQVPNSRGKVVWKRASFSNIKEGVIEHWPRPLEPLSSPENLREGVFTNPQENILQNTWESQTSFHRCWHTSFHCFWAQH